MTNWKGVTVGVVSGKEKVAEGSLELVVAGGLGVRTPLARKFRGEREDFGTFVPGARITRLVVAEDGTWAEASPTTRTPSGATCCAGMVQCGP